MKKIFTLLFFAILGLNNINAATFSSVSSGTWSAPATWTITSGTDTDGIPDSGDDVTINGGHTVILAVSVSSFKTLIIQAGGILDANAKNLFAYGNCTINGNMINPVYFRTYSLVTLSSVPTLTNTLNWIVQTGTLTIAAGTTINKPTSYIVLATGCQLVNNGNVTGRIQLGSTSTWINSNGSSLTSLLNIAGTGSLIASAASNTVTYNASTANQIYPSTYYNLVINAASTKSLTTNLTVLNDLTLGAGATNVLNLSNFNLTVGGNWTNNANTTILNQGTISFNGSGTQTITRTSNEVINNMVVGGTGTVLLGRSLNVSQSLTMTSGTLDPSASNFTVNVAGNFINNGGSIAQRGLINFNGTTAQTISGSSIAIFFNVNSVNSHPSGVLTTSNIFINNVLTVPSGIFGTSGAGVITIPATAATTYGRIGSVAGTLTGTGWNIESFIAGPAQKGWQWLSSPINGNTLADWDNDPRFYMSGVGGNDGFAAGFRSVRTFNEVTGVYDNVLTTTTPLSAGKGFMVWMADNNTTGLTAPLIYNSVGIPNFGNVSFPVTAGGAGSGYNLVGNPYACPITYSTVVANSGNLFSSFIILLENGSYATDPNGGIIAPNQGFMCCAASSGNIMFTEASKNIVTSPNILRSASKNNSIRFNVYNNVNGLGGQTSIEFSENSMDIFENNKDLSFLTSPYDGADNIWTNTTDNKSMLRNSLNSNDNEKNVPLTVKSGVYGMHTISVKGLENLTNYNSVVIEDLTTGKQTDLVKEQNYSFNAEEVDKEYNFIVHFSNKKQSGAVKETMASNILNENTSVYNTPSNVVVKFDMPVETPVQISVYNLTGQQVIKPMNLNVTNDRIALPLQKENGLYLLIIQSKDQQITRKIIY